LPHEQEFATHRSKLNADLQYWPTDPNGIKLFQTPIAA